MNSKETLKELLQVFARSRGTGCTTAMLRGVNDVESIVITNCERGKVFLKQQGYNGYSVSMYQIGGGRMEGVKWPVVMDNAAIIDALHIAISAIEKQESLVKRAKRIADRAASEIGNL